MSSSVPIPSLSTPSSAGGEVRRIDALFGVAWYDKRRTVPTASVGVWESESDVMIVFGDRRVVRCSGWWVHSDVFGKILSFLAGSIEGVHVKTIPLPSAESRDMTVNGSETLMVISGGSDDRDDKLYLYSLPGFDLLKTIGSDVGSSELGEFNSIGCVCFGSDDVIIVADTDNNRLQAFSSAGEYKRSIDVVEPWSVCVSNNGCMIGVGTYKNAIVLLDYGSAAVIRTINSTAHFGVFVTSVCFTTDDTHILVSNSSSSFVSMRAVADGSFVRRMCEGLEYGSKDVCFAANGDIIIADASNHRVCVFDADGVVLLKQIGRKGTGDGEFSFPTAVCCVNGRLYVLDYESPRVQVFE